MHTFLTVVRRVLIAMFCTLLLSGAARAAPPLVLEGTVTNTAGHVVPHAFVEADGVTVQTDQSGTYQLAVPVSVTQILVQAWAPGYRMMPVYFSSPDGGVLSGTITGSFTGQFALPSAFRNPALHAVLHGVHAVIASSVHTLHLNGTIGTPLEPRLSVTLPTGQVASYALHVRGGSFTATIPLHENGPYRLEINATSGFAVFNVPVFHGMAPKPPLDPSFPPEPTTGTSTQFGIYGLYIINHIRESLGLKDVTMRPQLVRVAQEHTIDLKLHDSFLTEPHLGSTGSTPQQRIMASGLQVHQTGEAVGEAATVAGVVTAFLDSPSHRAILIGDFRWAGIGIEHTPDGILMTLDLAR